MKNVPTLIIVTLLVMTIAMSYIEFLMNVDGDTLSQNIWGLWGFLNVVLVGTWVLYDNKSGNFEKPFDFGFFLYLFLPVLLLYYLIRTRGHEGVVTYLGFIAVYIAPEFLGLFAYAYY